LLAFVHEKVEIEKRNCK